MTSTPHTRKGRPRSADHDRADVKLVAVHEAGHAIAAWALRRYTIQIVLDLSPDDDMRSVCDHRSDARGFIQTLDAPLPDANEIVRSMIFVAAGNAAQRMVDPESEPSEGDERRLTALATQLCGKNAPGIEIGEAELRAERMADALVERNWEHVERLAPIIIEQIKATEAIKPEPLDANEINELIEAARYGDLPPGIETNLNPHRSTPCES